MDDATVLFELSGVVFSAGYLSAATFNLDISIRFDTNALSLRVQAMLAVVSISDTYGHAK